MRSLQPLSALTCPDRVAQGFDAAAFCADPRVKELQILRVSVGLRLMAVVKPHGDAGTIRFQIAVRGNGPLLQGSRHKKICDLKLKRPHPTSP